MIKNPVVVDKILKKLQTDYVKIEEERNKYQENLKSKKVQKKIIDRQTYIQNIEKKLNEIVAHSLEIKKQDKKPNFSLSHKNLPSMEMDEPKIINDMKIKQNSLSRAEKVKLNLFLQEKRMMKSKTRLCRLLFSTGICRWGDKCNFAHNIKEIEGEYRPKGFFFFF